MADDVRVRFIGQDQVTPVLNQIQGGLNGLSASSTSGNVLLDRIAAKAKSTPLLPSALPAETTQGALTAQARLRELGETLDAWRIKAAAGGPITLGNLTEIRAAQNEFNSLKSTLALLQPQAATAATGIKTVASTAASAGTLLRGVAGAFGAIGLTMGAAQLFNRAVNFGREAVMVASETSEAYNQVQVVFGGATASVEAFASRGAAALGMARGAAYQAVASFGDLFTTMNMTQAESADMSMKLVQLAADLASFKNIRPEDALAKLRSGLVGESEPLRSIGILLTEDAVNAKALAMGLAETTKEITAADKVQARYALILAQSGNAQGDFARTSDGLANSLRINQAAVTDLKTALGKLIEKPYTVVVQTVTKAVTGVTEAIESAPVRQQVMQAQMLRAELPEYARLQAAKTALTAADENLTRAQAAGYAESIKTAQAARDQAQAVLAAAAADLALAEARAGIVDVSQATIVSELDYVSQMDNSTAAVLRAAAAVDTLAAARLRGVEGGLIGGVETGSGRPPTPVVGSAAWNEGEAAKIRIAELNERIKANTTVAKDYAAKMDSALDSLRGKVESVLSSGTTVTAADMAATQAGTYTEKPLENVRRLNAIMERGFAELTAHPDWASVLAVPPEVLGGSEAALKAWAAQTSADVSALARPDLINWDAFVTEFKTVEQRAAQKEATVNEAIARLNAAGVLKGMTAQQQRSEVTTALFGAEGGDQKALDGKQVTAGLKTSFSEAGLGGALLSALTADIAKNAEQFTNAGQRLGRDIATAVSTGVTEGVGNLRTVIAQAVAPEVAQILGQRQPAQALQ